MVRGLRKRYDDRFTDYFSPESLEKFREEIAGKFSGVGLSVIPVKKGLEVGHVFKRSPADRAGIEVGEVVVSVEGDSIAGVDSEVATARIKGPEGTEGDGRRARPEDRQDPRADDRPRGDLAAGRLRQGPRGRWAQARLRPALDLQLRQPRLPAQGGREGRARRRRGDRPRPARQRRRAARRGRARGERLPARGRGRGDDRLAHPGARRVPHPGATTCPSAPSSS